MDWHLDLPPSACCSFAQFTWVKKNIKQGWVNILFLFHILSFNDWSCGSWGPSSLGVSKQFIKLLHPLIPWPTFDDGVHKICTVREAREGSRGCFPAVTV